MIERTPDLLVRGATPAEARRTVIAVHGRGQGAAWMSALADRVDDRSLRWLIPDAPDGSWYPARFMEPIEANQPHLDTALDRIDALIARAEAEGADPERTAVIGFSQGGCLVAHHALVRDGARGPIGILTGGYIGPEGTAISATRSLAGQQVYLETASLDPWVPLARVEETVAALRAAGADARLDVREGDDHLVPDAAIVALRRLLAG